MAHQRRKIVIGDYAFDVYRAVDYVSVKVEWLSTPLGQDPTVGGAQFWERDEDLFPEQVWVLEAHQRRGLATRMYEFASEIADDKPIVHSGLQSKQGWAFRNRLGGVDDVSPSCDMGAHERCRGCDCGCHGEPIIKRCGCGRTYTQAEWDALPLLGKQVIPAWRDEPEETLTMKNCVCHSTLAVSNLYGG
jgi:GNAT superfamily N-acetyltransferase